MSDHAALRLVPQELPNADNRVEAPAPIVVELRGVGYVYASEPPVEALRNVDLTIHKGDVLAIVGPSGSGKSTLMNVLGCLDRQTTGTYLIDGIDVGALSDRDRTAIRGSRIGFIFQTFNLLSHRTVLENVMLAEVYIGGSRDGRKQRAQAALERVGLADRNEFVPTRLSGGQRQRVAIARALMGSPSLLLCDEPTGNLDTTNTESVLGLFHDLGREGMTLVVVTHDEHVAAFAHREVRIVDGQATEMRR